MWGKNYTFQDYDLNSDFPQRRKGMWQYNCLIIENSIVQRKNDSSPGDLVLVVDDELDICYLIGGILRQRNLSAAYANSLSMPKQPCKTDRLLFFFLTIVFLTGSGLISFRL